MMESKDKIINSNERGAIIVLVAIMSVALMMIIGLVIDTSKLSTSKTAHEHTADMIALAMMESYSTQDLAASQADRIMIAAQRAEQVAMENLDAWVANDYIRNGGTQQHFISSSLNFPEGNTNGANGMIIPGFWFFEKPDSCNGGGTYTAQPWMLASSATVAPEGNDCPCGFNTSAPGVDADGWKGSCFKAVDLQADQVIVNAFKVKLKTADGSNIENTFSAVNQDAPTFGLNSEAVAAIVPRNILVAMDISPSITEETHTSRDNAETYGEFAYEVAALTSDPRPTPLTTRPGPPTNLGNFTCQTDFEAGLPGIANPSAPFDPLQCQRFSCLNEQYNAASPANTQFLRVGTPLREYCPATVSSQPSRRQTDYEAVSLNTSDPSEPLFSGTTFLIDATTRPEPLASLLQGVHSGMEAFEARGTGADQFGFAAVDDDFLPLRSTNFNSALGLPSLVKTGGPDGEFDRFLEATDYAAQESLPLASRPFIQNLLIPRQFSGKSFQRRNPGAYAQSDLAGVFSESLDILKNAPNSDIAASSLIMFTDGMASCHGGSCSISNATLNRRAINSIIAQARDEFAAAGIAFHVFLIGQDVAPHTQPRSGGAGTCLSDEQARRQDDPNSTRQDQLYVNFGGGNFGGRSPSSPYYYPNALYQAARWTGGAYVPLRPPCVDDSTPPNPIDITDNLNDACGTRALNERLFTAQDPVFANPVFSNDGQTVLYPDSVDGAGRLLCDPTGRTLEQQVAEEMEEILEQSPFLLVSERPNS